MSRKKSNIHSSEVPEPTLRRLPWYLAHVKSLYTNGVEMVSSTGIARAIGIDSALVAKDLSFVQLSGKTRVGYRVENIVTVLEDFLGFTNQHQAYIFGVGSLGAALISDKGLSQYGLNIVGGFDIRQEICGKDISGIPIYHMSELPERTTPNVTIGILTVPTQQAQQVCNQIIDAGIRAIWNFTPCRITVPENVVVQNTSLYAHLAVMFNRLKAQE